MSEQQPQVAQVNVDVVTLGDVRGDVNKLTEQVSGLSLLLREHVTRVDGRVGTLEERDGDKETRLRVIEQTGATRADVDALANRIDARELAAKQRMPAWASIIIAIIGVLVTATAAVVTTVLALAR